MHAIAKTGPAAADDIVEQAYEAAVIPELWPKVLDGLGRVVDAAGGILFVAAGTEIRWTSSPGTLDLMHAFVEEGWDKCNSRAVRLSAMNYPGFVHDLDIFTGEELDREPFYTEFCRPRGFGWAAGTIINVPNGDMMVYSFDRRFDAGPFERHFIGFLDGLRPHLARAGLMSARLQLERAKSSVGTLAALGLPAAILRSDGRVIAANPLLEGMSRHVRIGAFDRMHLLNKQADTLYAAGVRQLENLPTRGVLSLALPSLEMEMAVMHLFPIRRAARDIFNNAACIAIITPLAKPLPPSESLLSGLFDLTPAEARVARGLVCGGTTRSVAENLGIGYETVRNHLKTVLAKTGTHRQADLIALLAGTSPSGHGAGSP